MRLFESLELAVLLVYVLGFFISKRFRPVLWGALPFLALVLAMLTTLIEGYRAQMFVGHVLTAIFCLFTLYQQYQKTKPEKTWRWRHWVPRIITPVVALALCALAIALPYMFYVFHVPTPSGSYSIGTTDFSITDPNRLEKWTTDPYDHRELMVKMWYPADLTADSKIVPYDPYANEGSKVIARLMKQTIRLPETWFNYMGLVKSNSYLEPPVAAALQEYPIIIFSHGYLVGSMTQNTILMEELASNGYIVVSIGHTFETLFVSHPDGRVLPFNRERAEKFWGEVNETNDVRRILTLGHDEETLGAMFRDAIKTVPTLDSSINTWDEDVHFINDIVEELDRGDIPSMFKNRIDLTKRGVCGMSFGGTVTVRTALTDPRFSAALNLDGPLLAKEIFDCKHDIPFMHIIDSNNTNSFNVPVDGALGPVYKVMVSDTKHLNFSDAAVILPRFKTLRQGLGEIDGYHCLQIVNDYSLAFFDQYLKNKPSELLVQEQSPYKLVEVESRNIPEINAFTVARD